MHEAHVPAGMPLMKKERYWLYATEAEDGWVITGVVKKRPDGLAEVHIPAEVNGKPVVELAMGWTFDPEWPEYIERLYFPDSIRRIRWNALRYVHQATLISTGRPNFREENGYLLSMDGKTLVSILDWTKDVHLIPGSVEVIGEGGVSFHRAECVMLPEGLREIGDNAFDGASIPFLMIPDGVKRIGNAAFHDCDMSAVVLPEGLESIGHHAFACTSLMDVTLPSTVRKIGEGAFSYCTLLRWAHLPVGLQVDVHGLFSLCAPELRICRYTETIRLGPDADE